MRIAVFPGSFDPVTLGHRNIIERAARLFDRVYVCAMRNGEKRSAMFSDEEKLEMLRLAAEDLPNVIPELWGGLLCDYAREKGAKFLVKGARNATDFDAEHALADINREIDPELETVLLCADARYAHFSSTMAREMVKYKQELRKYVPEKVAAYIEERERV